MILIGIIGGVASGKSVVSEQLQDLGAVVLDADAVGHQVLREPEVREAIHTRWGPGVLEADGSVNRKAVAQIVFGAPPRGPAELTYLEQLTHPRIGRRLSKTVESLRQRGQTPAAVLDAPVMMKAGWHQLCDKILFVDARRPQRLQRAKLRGWSEAEFDAREANQQSLAVKRAAADLIVDNSSTMEHTHAQVQRIWDNLHDSE